MVLLFVFLFWGKADAAVFNVTPAQIYLAPDSPIALLNLANRAETPARFQIRLYVWEETSDGKMVLRPSNDIIFFPRLLAIGPKQTRVIRIGSEKPINTLKEKNYRIVLSQIPENIKSEGSSIRLLVDLSVPIFVVPGSPSAEARIADFNVKDNLLSFSFENRGNIHYMLLKIEADALNAQKKEVFQKKFDAWYILAGESRVYQVKLPTQNCNEFKAVRVKIVAEHTILKKGLVSSQPQKSFEQTFEMPPGGCNP